MRLTSLLRATPNCLPFRLRGKYRKKKEPTLKDLRQFTMDLQREEQNMLILRHPYLTTEQSHGHMAEVTKQKFPKLTADRREERNLKFHKIVTIADRLGHLNVKECWD